MKIAKKWIEIRNELRKSVAFIAGGHGRRAFDAVVIEIRSAALPYAEQTPKCVVLKTSGSLHMDRDIERLRRLIRRLKRMGVVFNSSLGCHANTGVCGTLFAHWRTSI